MIYAFIILGVLLCGVAFLLFMGFRSRNNQNIYIGAERSNDRYKANASSPSYPKIRTEVSEDVRDVSQLETAPNYATETHHHENTSFHESTTPHSDRASSYKHPSSVNGYEEIAVTGALEIESGYEEALIMLREVKAMLLQGRPDRAIQYISDANGVDYDEAAKFVSDVENKVIG